MEGHIDADNQVRPQRQDRFHIRIMNNAYFGNILRFFLQIGRNGRRCGLTDRRTAGSVIHVQIGRIQENDPFRMYRYGNLRTRAVRHFPRRRFGGSVIPKSHPTDRSHQANNNNGCNQFDHLIHSNTSS